MFAEGSLWLNAFIARECLIRVLWPLKGKLGQLWLTFLFLGKKTPYVHLVCGTASAIKRFDQSAAWCVGNQENTEWISIAMGIPPTDKVERIWLWSNGKNTGLVDQSCTNILMANVGGGVQTMMLCMCCQIDDVFSISLLAICTCIFMLSHICPFGGDSGLAYCSCSRSYLERHHLLCGEDRADNHQEFLLTFVLTYNLNIETGIPAVA